MQHSGTTTPSSAPLWQRIYTDYGKTIVIFLGFALIALTYFLPAGWDGRELFQPDVAGASGTAQDVRDFTATTGETSYWTNSLFGGMPMYQISPSYPSTGIIKWVQDLITLQKPFCLLPSYSWLLFAMMWGFYLFLRSLSVKRSLSCLGGIMWAFSSYFVILITAGHIWKLTTLAFIPPTIAGLVWLYRGRYLRGAVVMTFFTALQILSNHIQMSYYFIIPMGSLVVAYLVEAVRSQQLARFCYATLLAITSGVVALGINASNLYHTYQYTQSTMRGGSELTTHSVGDSPRTDKSGGLDRDYITQWSYGKAETLTLLVPNLYGGATGALSQDPSALESAPAQTREIVGQMNHYWGDQPFTAGPVYVGAFVLFLFILGCWVVHSPFKWALLVATLLSIFLSWGHNWMWLTDLFIDYIPLYNKFRTVSSILVVAEFTIPALAILALIEYLRDPRRILQEEHMGLYCSLICTLGLALLLALTPSTFLSLLSDQEQELFRQAMGQAGAAEVLSGLKAVRSHIVSADAWRSVTILLLSIGTLYLYYKKTLRQYVTISILGVITLVDLWMVDKRYLSDKDFIPSSQVAQMATPTTQADKLISQDKDPHYRVLNLTVSPFNDATTSAHHRSIGGYHAAKLARYQDLIDHCFLNEQGQFAPKQSVLNMLDTRYIIHPNAEGQAEVVANPEAYGAAWLAERVSIVPDADSEIAALSSDSLRYIGILRQDQAREINLGALSTDSIVGAVHLDSYTPKQASYTVQAHGARLLLFSEIYYPHGWHLYIDGQEAPLLRANYLLRATVVPNGVHKVEMIFAPHSIDMTELIAYIAQALLLLGIVLWIIQSIYQAKRSSRVTTSTIQ